MSGYTLTEVKPHEPISGVVVREGGGPRHGNSHGHTGGAHTEAGDTARPGGTSKSPSRSRHGKGVGVLGG